MSAQLVHLLGYLDRDGVSELVISSGRPVAVRVAGAYKPVTQHGVTTQQLIGLLDGTTLTDALPTSESNGDPIEAEIGGRPVRVQIMRRGDELLVRFEPRERAPGATKAVAAPSPAPRATPVPVAAAPRPSPVAPRPAPAAPQPAPIAPQPSPVAPPPATAAAAAAPPPPTASLGSMMSGPPPVIVPSPPLLAPVANDKRALIDEEARVPPALAALVQTARAHGASDLHIAAHRPVLLRVTGELRPLEAKLLSPAEVEALVLPLLGPIRRTALDTRGYVDLAIEVAGNDSAGDPRLAGKARLRANISRIQGGLKGAFRLALAKPPTLDELGLPKDLAKVANHHQGLVVIAGPSGHGKTTTLAALVDLINAAHPHHILTVEDPVEIEHPRKAAVISQREVNRHTLSFAAALKASLREDPDVIVIGELRDRETVEIALTAAETGHLVMSTMSTPSAAKTIDRLIDMFPPDDQSQVRASLAGALRAIVAQRLIPSADGSAMVAAVELLTGVLPLAAMIRDNKLFQLPNLMQRGRAFGMIRLDDSLAELVRSGKVTADAAMKVADSKRDLGVMLGIPVPGAAPAAPPPEPAAASVKSRLGGLFGKKEG